MPQIFYRYATPFITGLFLVSLISGVALFFHVGPSGFRGMHEWLSMVLIVPFVLHLWRNWRAMMTYFRRAPMWIGLAVSLVAAGVFLLPSASDPQGGNPAVALTQKIVAGTPAQVGPALGLSADEVAARLAAAGITVAPGQSLAEAATAAGKTPFAVAAALVAK